MGGGLRGTTLKTFLIITLQQNVIFRIIILLQDTFKAFTSAGWGEAGVSAIDMSFVEKVRDAMAEAVEEA